VSLRSRTEWRSARVMRVVVLGLVCLAVGCGSSESSGSATGGSSSGGAATGGTSSGGAAGVSGGGSSTGGASGSGGSVGGGFPDATNTGIPEGACPNGLVAATLTETEPASGKVIECYRFDGAVPYIRPEIKNVTYRYCRFETKDDTFLNLQGGPVTIEDSEFTGPAGTWIRTAYDANDLSVRRCNFSGMANAIEFGTTNVVIEDNYVHDFGNVTQDQHADGFQTEGADSFTISHNTVLFNEVWGSTSALLLKAGAKSQVKDNLLAGGGYTIHVSGDLDFVGNRVSTKFHPDSGIYGPVYPESLAPSGVWQDNAWHDGPKAGQPIAAP